jgi:hypothetical protein
MSLSFNRPRTTWARRLRRRRGASPIVRSDPDHIGENATPRYSVFAGAVAIVMNIVDGLVPSSTISINRFAEASVVVT